MAILQVIRVFRPNFSCIIDCDLPHGTFLKGPKGFLKRLHDHFFQTQEVVENTNFWKKKAILPVKKMSRPIFSRITECDKP